MIWALALTLAAQPPSIDLEALLGRAQEATADVRAAPSPAARLEERLEALLTAETDERAAIIADEVRSLWRQQAGPTADLLLQRAAVAREIGDDETAERAYAHLRLLESDTAEVWIVSAEYAASQGDWSFALEALNTAVTLDARRFDAWSLLGQTFERAGAEAAAFEAYGEVLALYPRHEGARAARARLDRSLAGRAL